MKMRVLVFLLGIMLGSSYAAAKPIYQDPNMNYLEEYLLASKELASGKMDLVEITFATAYSECFYAYLSERVGRHDPREQKALYELMDLTAQIYDKATDRNDAERIFLDNVKEKSFAWGQNHALTEPSQTCEAPAMIFVNQATLQGAY